MERRVLFLLTFFVWLARLQPQSLPDQVSSVLPHNPAMTCRAKQPFPFTAIQLVKKRLSSPPANRQTCIARGASAESPDSGAASFFMDTRPAPALIDVRKSAFLPVRTAGGSASGIERNVFHPPPSLT